MTIHNPQIVLMAIGGFVADESNENSLSDYEFPQSCGWRRPGR